MKPKKKGGKKKSKGNKEGVTHSRTLELKDELQEYAKILKLQGDRRIIVMLPDSSEVLAIIPGRFRKRVWMGPGDVIVVSHREFQDGKMDVIYKYHTEEIRSLHKMGEIPDFFTENIGEEGVDDEDDIVFADDPSEEKIEIDYI